MKQNPMLMNTFRNMLKRILAKPSLLVLMEQGLNSGLSFLVTIMLAKLLPIAEFGLFASIILGMYLLLGTTNAYIISPMQVMDKVTKSAANYLQVLLRMHVLFMAIFGFAIVVGWCILHSWLSIDFVFMLAILSFVLGFLTVDFGRKIFITDGRYLQIIILGVTYVSGQVLALISVYVFKLFSLQIVLWALALGMLPAIVVMLFYIRPHFKTIKQTKNVLIQHHSIGKWYTITSITQWVSTNWISSSTGILLGINAFGALRLGQSIFGLLNLVLQVYESYLLPKATELLANSKHDFDSHLEKLSVLGFTATAGMTVVAFVLKDPIMMWFGNASFVPYSFIIPVLALLYLLIFTLYPVRMAIRVYRLERHFFIGYLASIAFNLCLTTLFIQYWGLAGALTLLICNQLLLTIYWAVILTQKGLFPFSFKPLIFKLQMLLK